MASRGDYTTIGGVNVRFPQTEWTRVIDPAVGQEILEELVARYWKPLYCFLRMKGYQNEEAKDLTQGFFTEIIFDGSLFKSLDRSKGKFRTLLITALNHYIIDVARYRKRKRRHPGLMLSLDVDLDVPDAYTASPEQAFDYGWASDLLEKVLVDLKAECMSEGLATHWDVFEARVLTPIFEDRPAPSLGELCRRLGIVTESRASNMVITVKRRFRQLLRRHFRKFVDSDTEVENEIARLVGIFAGGAE